jgi:hypothetical protein
MFIFHFPFLLYHKFVTLYFLIQGPLSSTVLERVGVSGILWYSQSFRNSSIRISSQIPGSPFIAFTTPLHGALWFDNLT